MKINVGETIGIIALSGDCERDKVEQSKLFFERLGYKVKLSSNIYDKNRYLAGSDEDKVKELHKFFKDSEIKLILAARGGYGAIRLINSIDYDLIRRNPKPFCGFSDVTALLVMLNKKSGLITYHSPMACSDFASDDVSDFTLNNFLGVINSEITEFYGDTILNNGNAEGILWGGNLSTIVSLCGQDFIPDNDFIFFTEDLNEPVYKIDKMFNQLINIKGFTDRCKGIVLGDFLEVDNQIWLKDLFNELAGKLDIPIVSGFKITHNKDKITLPIGERVILEGNVLKLNKG